MRITWWHRLVAKGLVLYLEERNEFIEILDRQIKLLRKENDDLAIECNSIRSVLFNREDQHQKELAKLKTITFKAQDLPGEIQCALVARNHAASRSSGRVQELYNEIARLRTKLAKFNQK